MNKFILSLTKNDVAAQIAHLLNIGDQFYYTILPHYILSSDITYIIEMDRNKVIGTIGVQKKNGYVTELKHLAVHPDYRSQGIGKRLLKKGIDFAPTKYVYGLVRSTNTINIRNNLRLGMEPIAYCRGYNRNYKLIVFAKAKTVEAYNVG